MWCVESLRPRASSFWPTSKRCRSVGIIGWRKLDEHRGISDGSRCGRVGPLRFLERLGRRSVLMCAAAFLAAFLVGVAPGLAHAGWADSSVGGFGPVNGHSYENYASVYTPSGYAIAYTYTGPSGSSVASGWVGSRGRLFTSGGSLSCEGSNTYSTQTLTSGSYWSGTSCSRGSGAWYSYGVSLAFNGSGYNSYYTFQSPNQNS
jgi:hypothetical protein